jgi:hypothetical protein
MFQEPLKTHLITSNEDARRNDIERSRIKYHAAQQSLAADGAIASFSSSLVPSARMLIARRS